MNSRTHCPVCNNKLERVTEEEKKRLHGKKYEDEDVFWCPLCKEYVYEEDFLYNTEE